MIANNVEKPARKTKGSAGYDFHAPEDIDLEPGVWTTINLGVRFTDSTMVRDESYKTSRDWFMMLVPRSGLGAKYGLRLRNTVGVIDSTYRDDILATVTVDVPLHVGKGDRILQGVFMPYLTLADEDEPTEERRGGFGSTGN